MAYPLQRLMDPRAHRLLGHFVLLWHIMSDIGSVDHFYDFWIQKSQHFYVLWIQISIGPFLQILDPETAVFPWFLDPEIAPFLQYLDPEIFWSIFMISGSRNRIFF